MQVIREVKVRSQSSWLFCRNGEINEKNEEIKEKKKNDEEKYFEDLAESIRENEAAEEARINDQENYFADLAKSIEQNEEDNEGFDDETYDENIEKNNESELIKLLFFKYVYIVIYSPKFVILL